MRTLILILLLAFASNAFSQAQGTPTGRFKAVIDNLRNADTSAAQLGRISDRLLPAATPGVDTSAWTNSQKATAVLAYLRASAKRDLEGATRQVEQTSALTTVQATAASAAADMD